MMIRLFQQHINILSLAISIIGIAVGAMKPKNVAIGWNETAVLNCTMHGGAVFWFNTSSNFSTRPIRRPNNSRVYDSIDIAPYFWPRMRISPNTSDLMISPQFPFDAAEYFCVDATSCCEAASAQLVVIGSNVSCNIGNCCTFANSSTFNIRCDIQYVGNMTAAVHCEANSTFLFNGSLSANIVATESLNSTIISCRAYFEPKQPPTSAYCASNRVLTEYVYTSSSINVILSSYSSTTVPIYTTRAGQHPENPISDYTGSEHVTMTATSSSASSLNVGAIIGGIIGGVFGILIIVVIIVLVICCFTKRKENERKKTSSMATLPIVQLERDKKSTFIESESPGKYSQGYEDVDGIRAHQTDAPDILRTNETNRNNGQSVKSLYPQDDDEQDDTKTDEQTMMYAELQTNKKPLTVPPTESPAPVVVTENQTYAAIDHRPQNAG